MPQVPRILNLVEDLHGWEPLSRNLDFGGGPYEFFTEELAVRGVYNFVFDKWARSPEHQRKVTEEMQKQPADTATIADVLNILPERQDRVAVLMQVREWLKPNGRVYITVHDGDQSGNPVQQGRLCQMNLPLEGYLDEVRTVFSDAALVSGMIVGTKSV